MLIFVTFFLWHLLPRWRYISITNQNIEKARHTLVDWWFQCEWDCAAILLVLQNPIPDTLNRWTLGRFTPYRLLTHTKKTLLKLYFYPKVHLLSFLLIYSLLGFHWNWRVYDFFSQRAPAKVASNLKFLFTWQFYAFEKFWNRTPFLLRWVAEKVWDLIFLHINLMPNIFLEC